MIVLLKVTEILSDFCVTEFPGITNPALQSSAMRIPSLFLFIIFAWSTVTFAQSLVFPPYGHSYGIRKATSAHLFMFFGPTTAFENPQGIATAKMVSRDDPTTEGDDDEVVVYGVNAGRNELIYNTSMWTLARYGSKGSGKDQFLEPRGVATEPRGNVFVADSGNNRIVHLFNPRKKVEWVRAYRGNRRGDKGFNGPSQVALDEQCKLYVSDTKNGRIVVIDTTGSFFQVIVPLGGSFENGPTTLAVADGTSRYSHFRHERLLFCADRGGKRLWKLSLDGIVIKTVDMPGIHRACYAAVDYYHNLWVTDIINHCIVKFDHNLELLDVFGSYGKGDNQFVEPRGIAIWKRYGQTFIAERKGAQYFWIGSECRTYSVEEAGEQSVRLNTDLTEYSYISLFGSVGSDTSYLFKKQFVPAGKSQRVFAIPERTKNILQSPLTLRVEPTYSSYTYYHWDFPVSVQERTNR